MSGAKGIGTVSATVQSSRSGSALCVALTVVGLISGCSTANLSQGASLLDSSHPLKGRVLSEQNPQFADYHPNCIYVRAFEDPLKKDSEQIFRKAFHAQLAVTGIRLVPLQAVPNAQSAEACEVELRGKVIANDKRFMGVYSDYRAAVEVELFHRSRGSFLWRGADEISKRDGGLPIGVISSILGVMNAAKNIEQEQEGRIAYELAARVVSQIPNLTYQPEEEMSKVASSLVPTIPPGHPQTERAVDFLVRMNDFPVEQRGVHFRKILESPTGLTESERNLLREEWLLIDPNNTELGLQVLAVRVHSSRHADALNLANSLIERTEGLDARVFKLRSMTRSSLGQYDLAANDELKVIALGNRTEDAYFSLGRTYARMGQFELSAAALEMAANLNPDNSVVLLYLGVSVAAVGERDRAFGHLRRALVLEIARDNRAEARKVRNAMLSTETYGLFSEAERNLVEQTLEKST